MIRQLWSDIRETSDKEIASFDEIINNSDNDLGDVKAYLKRVAATREDSLLGHFFLNGKHRPFNEVCVARFSTRAEADPICRRCGLKFLCKITRVSCLT